MEKTPRETTGSGAGDSAATIRRRVCKADPEHLEGLPPLLARLYATRGIHDSGEASLRLNDLLPVSSLTGTDAAVELLLRHHAAGTPTLVVGDFDADGATSSALVVRALRALGLAQVDFLVPNRFEFGYGLSAPLVAVAAASRPGLIITVDNGISSVDGVAAANAAGIDVLITDHHLPPARLPSASAIVNPNLDGETFASKHLAGVGVAFYLMAALASRMLEPGRARQLAAGLLDLVALGTVADVVTLDRNNRILVEHGLRRIRSGNGCPGIRALLQAAGRNPAGCVASDLGFVAGPRLNAAGRLDDMSIGIRCLLSDSEREATALAATLSNLNEERRDIEAQMQDQALQAVAEISIDGDLPVAFSLFDERWHQGVVGLVAGRIKERYHRPVVAFALDKEDRLKGSARSIRGLHIRDVLAEVDSANPGLIERFGGHAMAAGLSLPKSSLAAFSSAFVLAAERHLAPEDLERELLSDGELADDQLDLDTAELLRSGGPWGQGFPEPVFDNVFEVRDRRILRDRHLKLKVRLAGGRREIDALAFNQLERAPDPMPRTVRLVYRLDINEYRGLRSPQLVVEQISVV
ncbi:MAG: single-stranded-DNA-specific exonuclease RecJ [Gammaproteobacteria bacterium]